MPETDDLFGGSGRAKKPGPQPVPEPEEKPPSPAEEEAKEETAAPLPGWEEFAEAEESFLNYLKKRGTPDFDPGTAHGLAEKLSAKLGVVMDNWF